MKYVLLVPFILSAAACTPAAPDPRVEAARAYIKEVTGDDLKAGGGLRITVRKAVVDGRHARISGTVENRYAERVEGIRYTVRRIVPGDPPRVVSTTHHEVDTSLDPGQDRSMRIEIEDPIHASAPGFVEVEADPVRLGDREIPPPEGWR